ncbi:MULTISPECIES: hypothetical protein [Actinomadura]|uniref:Uncharacterized protein n=1 Tax=Actinomadura yumaensis TaxID=111807 RepID=A0ABW2CIC2_9ACTN|nr:hypothetical protein [Actinomadura sp. J1-007]
MDIKLDAAGASISCASQPDIVATMLEQLHVEPATRSWNWAPGPATTPVCSPT